MIARRIALSVGLATLGAVGAPESSLAQRVSADIHIGSGPVAGTIRVGDPYYRVYGRPRHASVEVYPARVVVERRHGWNPKKHRNGRFVVVYYDRDCDLYFNRNSRGLEQVRVFQDGGRFYRYDDFRGDDRDGRWDRHDRDRDRDRDDRDRYDRRDDRREDKDRDWYYERNGRKNDNDRWEHDHQH